jgi:hypothetical protein
MLWVAWCISICAFAAHLYEARGSSADLYSIIGAPAALTQALLIYLISRRNNIARVIVLSMAVPALIVALVFFSAKVSSLRLVFETLLRGTALVLLLTPGAAQWFKRTPLPE